MRRFIAPVIGLAIVIITLCELRATRTNAAPLPVAKPSAPLTIAAEGRVVTYPGAEVIVGSDVAGMIERLTVEENQHVRKGQIVAVVRAEDTRAALASARSRVGETEADVRLYELEEQRTMRLFKEDVGSKQAWEKSQRDLDAARARRSSATSEVQRLSAVLDKTTIVSPIDGVVVTRDVHPGETVVAGAPLMTIADLSRTRIEAEVDEYDAGRVALGGAVSISAEGFDNKHWNGKIEEIPEAVVNRRIKPLDASKPIDTRVLLVKVAMTESTPLKLGQRCDVRIVVN